MKKYEVYILDFQHFLTRLLFLIKMIQYWFKFPNNPMFPMFQIKKDRLECLCRRIPRPMGVTPNYYGPLQHIPVG